MSALATHSTFVAKVQALAGRKVLRLKTSHHTSGDLLPKKGQVRSPLSSLLTIYFGPKVKTLRSQRVASPLVHRHLFGNQTQPTIDSKSPRHHEGFFWVHRHLPERYYSEPNGAAILLGRVDLSVDHGYFGNHMTIIQESPKADDTARRFRIGSGPGLCIKPVMCGGLSQSALSSQKGRSLTVTFCRKSRPIINGRLF